MENKLERPQGVCCDNCDECVPLGDGDFFCLELMELVVIDYVFTEHFNGCESR